MASVGLRLLHPLAIGHLRGSPVALPIRCSALALHISPPRPAAVRSALHRGLCLGRRVIALGLASSSPPRPLPCGARSAAPPPASPRALRPAVGLLPSAPRSALRPIARRRRSCALSRGYSSRSARLLRVVALALRAMAGVSPAPPIRARAYSYSRNSSPFYLFTLMIGSIVFELMRLLHSILFNYLTFYVRATLLLPYSLQLYLPLFAFYLFIFHSLKKI